MRRYSEVSIGPSCGLALRDRADSKITRAERVEKQGSLIVKLSRVTNLKNQNLRAVSKNITTVSEVLANCSTALCRSTTAVMLGYIVTWVSILAIVNTQCYLQEVSNTQSNGVKRMEIEVDLNEEIQGFLALTSLLRQETFLIQDRYIVT